MKDKKASQMGFASMYLMAEGGILGAAVFTLLPSMLAMTGRSAGAAMLVGTILAALVSIPTVFLSATIDLPGGFYSQSAALLPPWLAGLSGLMTVISSLGFGTVGINMALNTVQMFPELAGVQKMIALGYFVLFFLMGTRGAKRSATVQNVLTMTVLAALLVFICGGLREADLRAASEEAFFSGGADGFCRAAATLSLSAMGGTQLINFTTEARNPKRDIPLGVAFSMGSAAVLFCLAAKVCSSGIVPVSDVSVSGLGVVAEAVLGKSAYMFFMIGGALFGLGASLNVAITVLKYPVIQMVNDGWLPKALAREDNRAKCPYLLMSLAFLIGAVLPVVTGLDIVTITSVFSLPSSILRCVITLSLLRLPRLFPERWNASRLHVPRAVLRLLVAVSTAASVFLVVCFLRNLRLEVLITSFAALVALSVYVLWRYHAGYVNRAAIRIGASRAVEREEN